MTARERRSPRRPAPRGRPFGMAVLGLVFAAVAHAQPAPSGGTGAMAGVAAAGSAMPPAGSDAATQTKAQAPLRRLALSVQYRGRLEGTSGLGVVGGADDAYYLNRLRLDARAQAAPWLALFGQVQDARVAGYALGPAPTVHVNHADLRQGYVEVGRAGSPGVLVRVGRQDISLGEQRLLGGLDWTNTARAFDAVRATLTRPGLRADVFVAAVVVPAPRRADRRRTDERLYAAYLALDQAVPRGLLEPYLVVKDMDEAIGERGDRGDGRTVTIGFRSAGTLRGGVDYSLEHAWQRGWLASDRVSARAGHVRAGWRPGGVPWALRLVGEVNHASGDRASGDGRRGTFDQLYPTNHAKYGIADIMGWRNMRDAMAGVDLRPHPRVTLTADVHGLWLATTNDGLYAAGGGRLLLNRAATSRRVATELDVQVQVRATRRLAVAGGVAYVRSGGYLVQTTGGGVLWAPHVMWTLQF